MEKEQGQGHLDKELHRAWKHHPLDLLTGKIARNMRDNLLEVPDAMLQMIKFCLPGEECPQRLADRLMFILLLDTLSARRMNLEGRKDKTSIKGTMMMLVTKEILTNRGTKMVTIGMKGTPGTTKTLQTLNQPGVLITEENLRGSSKGLLSKINDPSRAP